MVHSHPSSHPAYTVWRPGNSEPAPFPCLLFKIKPTHIPQLRLDQGTGASFLVTQSLKNVIASASAFKYAPPVTFPLQRCQEEMGQVRGWEEGPRPGGFQSHSLQQSGSAGWSAGCCFQEPRTWAQERGMERQLPVTPSVQSAREWSGIPAEVLATVSWALCPPVFFLKCTRIISPHHWAIRTGPDSPKSFTRHTHTARLGLSPCGPGEGKRF